MRSLKVRAYMTEASRVAIRHAIGVRPHSLKELAAITGLPYLTVRRYVVQACALGDAHCSATIKKPGVGRPVNVFAAGRKPKEKKS